MKVAYVKNPAALTSLSIGQRPDPSPAGGEICVRVHASSLNYHDYAVVSGMAAQRHFGKICLSY